MRFKLNIECDNDAFADDPAVELARILHKAAEKVLVQVDQTPGNFPLFDANGNKVGQAIWGAR